jgi:hypothetical protein
VLIPGQATIAAAENKEIGCSSSIVVVDHGNAASFFQSSAQPWPSNYCVGFFVGYLASCWLLSGCYLVAYWLRYGCLLFAVALVLLRMLFAVAHLVEFMLWNMWWNM